MFFREKYQDHISCSFYYKLVCVDDKLSKLMFVYRSENAVNRFIEAILETYKYWKKTNKKDFNKNLIMTEKEEENC